MALVETIRKCLSTRGLKSVVMRLMYRRLLSYHHVYADNYFTSVHLAKDLQPYYSSERYKSKQVLYKWARLMES